MFVFPIMLDANENPFEATPVFQSFILGLRLTSSARAKENWYVRVHRYTIPLCQTSPILPLLIKILHYCPHLQRVCCTLYSSDSAGQRALRITLFSAS